MKTSLLAGVAIVALFGRAEAQSYPPLGPGWSQQSAAYLAGPPVVREPNLQITWSGYTQWGKTLYFASDDGRTGILWQFNPSSPWFYKTSTGESGVVPLEDMQQDIPQQMPAYAPAPRHAPPQMSTAGFTPAPVYAPPPAPVYQAPVPNFPQVAGMLMLRSAFCALGGRYC